MASKEFKILAVDDDPSITEYLELVLDQRCAVVATNAPGDALRLAHEYRPDLILCDVEMPQIDGYELCRQFKADVTTQDIPIIFLTSTIDAQGEIRGFSAGGVDYLHKGVDLAVLEARIETRIALRRARRALESQNVELETRVAQQISELVASRQALSDAMHNLRTTRVCTGVYWIQVPEANLYILCGSPADVVKHLMLRGYIAQEQRGGVNFETGPNVILLSDVMMQNGGFANLSEFPVLQMLYRQGLILPGHPNNVGRKPMLIGSEMQVRAQLDYIYRGNYGLTSEEELRDAGLDEAEAQRQMAIKLGFAFGKIRATDELLDYRYVETAPVLIANDVWVRRVALNRYEFRYRDAVSEVDLNLLPGEAYESPYSPGHQLIDRQYFAVIHCGEGDGWDMRRQSMGSIVVFQGRYYLVDAGPSILDTLLRLGIDISEIDGIFHTHAHDDHFAGLPALISAGHRIKYFATPVVRHSVTKKLAALMSIDERLFGMFFDICDLAEGRWNDCDGMEVMPIYSPHPVENNIFIFRAMDDDGFKTYAHWADIASMDVLRKLVSSPPASEVLPPDFVESIRTRYLTPTSIKKLDTGGGMIHGEPLDFASDTSEKIILAHRAGPFSRQELEIGSQTSFGAVDILISTSQDYLRQRAYRFLNGLFPEATPDKLNALMRASIETYNAGSIILKRGAVSQKVYLLLTGTVEYSHEDFSTTFSVATGSILGARALFQDEPLTDSWRATSAVRLMGMSVNSLRAFLQTLGWHGVVRARVADIEFLQQTWLFGTQISSTKHARLAANRQLSYLAIGDRLVPPSKPCLYILRDGELGLINENMQTMEVLHPGEFIGEELFLGHAPRAWQAIALKPCELVALDTPEISNIPIVLWKLLEIYEKRAQLEQIGGGRRRGTLRMGAGDSRKDERP